MPQYLEANGLQVLHGLDVPRTAPHVFAVELDDEQLRWLRAQVNVPRGIVADTERTYVEVRTLRELLAEPLTDWSNLGMILTTLIGDR